MTGYEAFSLYNALKLHFSTDSYDFFKYRGKSRISIDAFENRKDKYFFYKLSRQQDQDDYIQFLVSNFLIDDKIWVGKLFEEDALVVYKKRVSVIQSLSYTFQNDCQKIRERVENFNDALATDGDYPPLLTLVLRNDIQIETLCILNSLMNFLPMWKNKISDTIRYPEFHRRCLKYSPFINFDRDKFKQLAIKSLK